jgi:hypothetical protein
MTSHAHPAPYEARIDGPVSARARWAARLGGPEVLRVAEQTAVARTQAALARDLVAGIAAARLQAVCGAGVPVTLARRVRALAALRARAVATAGVGRG